MTSSFRTPITESHGPHMPTSVTKAVPPGSTRASAVCTCVCVPSTAETLPSRNRPIAFFSLVASQCMSTRMALHALGPQRGDLRRAPRGTGRRAPS